MEGNEKLWQSYVKKKKNSQSTLILLIPNNALIYFYFQFRNFTEIQPIMIRMCATHFFSTLSPL